MKTDQRVSRALLLIAACGVFDQALPAADPIAYVSTYAQNYITTVDPSTGKVTRIANAGTDGANFVVSPDRSAAYVVACASEPTSCSVEAIDLVSGKIIATNVGGRSFNSEMNLAISNDGSLLYFAGLGDLTVVSTASLTVSAQVPLPLLCNPCRVVLAPDGSKIYVSSASDPEGVEVLDASTDTEITQVLPTVAVSGTAVSADGKTLYILSPGSKTMVYVLDTGSDAVTATIPYTNEGDVSGAAASPDGAMLYVTSPLGLVRIATPANTVVDQIPSMPLSDQIAVSADSQYVFVNREYGGPSGLLRFDAATATYSTLSIGGPAIAEQAAGTGGPVYVLQGSYSIATEDTVTEKARTVGTALGTYALTVSSSGNAVAGISQFAEQGELSIALISVVSTLTHEITKQFTSTFPNFTGTDTAISFAVSGDGSLGYAGYTNETGQATIAVLQLAQGVSQSTFSIPTPYPTVGLLSLAVSPDSSTLYSLLSVYVAFDGATTESICGTSLTTYASTGCAPLALGSGQVDVGGTAFTVTPDGSRAYIQTFQGDNVIGAFSGPFLSEVNLQSMSLQRAAELPFTSVEEGKGTIAYSSATNSVYMTNAVTKGGSIVRFDLTSFTVAVTQYVGYAPTGIAITPDGTELLVTGSLGGTQILDGTTLAPTGFISGGLQQSIVLAPQ